MLNGRVLLNEERKLRIAAFRSRAALVDPKKIRISGVLTIVGGLIVILGTFLPFNRSTITSYGVISRNAYQMGPQLSNNGVGVWDSILGFALIAIGISIVRHYRGYWFDPQKHGLAAIVTGVVIFNQMNGNRTSLTDVSYSVGIGWYLCMVGAAVCFIASTIRFPSKAT